MNLVNFQGSYFFLERERETERPREINALAKQASLLFFKFGVNYIVVGAVRILSLGAAYILFDLVINVKYSLT